MDVEQSKTQDLYNGKHLQEIQQVLGRIRRFHYIRERSADGLGMTVNKLGIDIVVVVLDIVVVA